MSSGLVVIKLGGACLQNDEHLKVAIESIRGYRKYEYRVVLVHGGGPAISAALKDQNINFEFVNGQRKTTLEMMDIIEDVLVNQVNSRLVSHLNASYIPAVGFSGAENSTFNCTQANPELGQVGQINQVNTLWVQRLLSANGSIIPVIAPVGIGANGEKYNINADWAAAKMASALGANQLIFLTDQEGVLNSERKLIPFTDLKGLDGLTSDGIVTGGMLTKVSSVIDALSNGVEKVRIMGGNQAVRGLWNDYIGTMCVRGAC